jgi:asparagine N-glycosylation enzyme membrane subunit Stt3
VTSVASFFTSQDEESANEIIRELDSSYIIIDYETATSKFYAMVIWAGKEQSEFFDVYYVPQGNQLAPVLLYYPAYYRSLSTRLYNFDGKAVTPTITLVISYEERVSQEGTLIKVIASAEQFDSYEEAEAYLLSQESANYRIANNNPFSSPVPLEALEYYSLIHSSDNSLSLPDGSVVPAVKIFQYID